VNTVRYLECLKQASSACSLHLICFKINQEPVPGNHRMFVLALAQLGMSYPSHPSRCRNRVFAQASLERSANVCEDCSHTEQRVPQCETLPARRQLQIKQFQCRSLAGWVFNYANSRALPVASGGRSMRFALQIRTRRL
jgi:hypothetical protein